MYVEGDVPFVTGNSGNNNGSGMWGSDGIWAILLLALLGRNGFGGFGGGYGSGSEFVGYELGKTATQADIASGFNNSAVLSSLNDLKLGQANGFAGVQQTLCQGFSGINTAILQSANATERGFATLGYNLANCCCDLKGAIADVKYANERQTCEIISAINMGNQRLVDIYTNDKIDTLNRKLATAEAQISNYNQSRYITDTILDKLSPCPRPAYITCNPNTGLTYPAGYTQANFGTGCSGCGI